MAAPNPEQIEQLFAIHNSAARRSANLLRAYGFDTTRTWIDPNGYRLSDRLWRARVAVREQIDAVLRRAIAEGADALEVAEILEAFLNPDFAPVRNINGRLIRDSRQGVLTRAPGRSGMGSFAARRLARTEITRASGVATIETAKRTPFASKIAWRVSGRHPGTDECDDNADRGPYDPGDVPRYPAHPQCLCTLTIEPVKDVDAVIEDLRKQYGLDE